MHSNLRVDVSYHVAKAQPRNGGQLWVDVGFSFWGVILKLVVQPQDLTGFRSGARVGFNW